MNVYELNTVLCDVMIFFTQRGAFKIPNTEIKVESFAEENNHTLIVILVMRSVKKDSVEYATIREVFNTLNDWNTFKYKVNSCGSYYNWFKENKVISTKKNTHILSRIR